MTEIDTAPKKKEKKACVLIAVPRRKRRREAYRTYSYMWGQGGAALIELALTVV